MRSSSRLLRLSLAAAITLLIMVSWFIGRSTTSAQSDTAPEQPSGLSTEAGDTQVRLSWEDPDDSTIDKYELWQIAESATLTAANNEFGYSVAVAGDIAVIGMPDDDESGLDSEAALVFSRVDGVWTQKYWLRPGDDAGVVKHDGFGSSIAFDGETIVVGAPFDDSKKGAAYLFVKPGDGWDNPNGTDPVDLTDPAKLTAPNAAVGDEFGYSVAMDGNTVVVGAYSDDSTDTDGNTVANSGSAYVFTKPGNAWVSTSTAATLTASDAAAGDEFGSSVAVDGNTIVVGASGDDGDALEFTGSAFVFVKPNGGWVSTSTAAKLIAYTRGNQDYFGRSVAIDGDTIVVGADGQESNKGSAFVFAEPSGGWVNNTETAKLTASVRSGGHRFGFSVALDGDTVVVGAYGEASSRGSAYAFTMPGTGWATGTETAQLTASDAADNDRFGSSVAIDGDTVVVGAQNNDTAYVFDIDDWADIAGSNAATTSHIVTGLTNDIDHTFRVRAVNTVGARDPFDSVSETPKAAAYPPARPRNFSATQTGDGEVEMTWDAHRYPLTVSGYEYNQDGGDWDAITGSDSSTHSHTVTGLTKGTTYTFAVRAVNGAGSTKSDSRSVTIVAKPAAPDSFTAVAGDEQVWLGWRSPADFTISGYEYRQKEGTDDFGVWQKILGSRSGTTFHIVTGLTNDTSYTFQVRAVNAAGKSDATDPITATPVAETSTPGVPEGFAARQTGVGHVELTWVASSNPLNVTGYQFRQDNGSWTTISGSDSRTVSHSVTGLTQGVTYAFLVRAVNNSGNGDSSGAESVTVVAKPAAPTGLTINDPEPGSGSESDIGDTQVRLKWNDPGNTSITKYQILQFAKRLISNDRSGGDELGSSVAVDGDPLVIGALGDDDTANLSGSAYVFTRVAGGWTQAGKLTASDPKEDAGFGRAVAVHGDTIVVGAYEDDYIDPDDSSNNLTGSGAAYVFTKPANGWADMTQTARLTASDAAADDEFGTSVAVHEDTIVVGAPEEDPGARGSAYIFTKPANGWAGMTETAALRGQLGGDRFGSSVAVYGDTVVVGTPEEGTNDRGEAYVFTKRAATGVWDDWHNKKANTATAKLTAFDRADNDRFGRAVAMDGDTIVVGAPYNDDDGDSSGSAYVFIKPAAGWATDTETAKLTASDGKANGRFGFSVAIDGDTIVIGPPDDDGDSNTNDDEGAAYVFTKPATGWATDTETATLTAYDRSQNDRFGNSVAVDGDTVLVGAVGDDGDRGSAYVFGTGEWADIAGSGAGTISHIAKGLRNNVKHTFRVRAVNAAGESDPPTDEKSATPVAATSAPAAPANFSATQTGVGQVELTWDAHLDSLSVTGYEYNVDAGGGPSWNPIPDSDSSTVSHAINDLTVGSPPTQYAFAVRAVNTAFNKDSNSAALTASGSKSLTLVAQPAAAGGLAAVAGDEQVKLTWNDPVAGSPPIAKYQLLQLDPSKLTASDGLRGDEFGISVAVDGDTAVIGAYLDDTTNGDNSGSAYVFTKVSGVWRQAAKLTASDGAANDEFGYSVAVDGDTIVVGAHQDDADDQDNNEGAAYVFTEPALGWGDWSTLDTDGKAALTVKLTAYQGAANDEFGISVAVNGNTILVGAHQNDADASDNNEGAAYIFTKSSSGWGNAPASGDHRVETAKLIASDATAGDEFGISVAVDGDTAVIGAYHDDHTDDGNTIGNAGSAYVFTKVSGVWSQKAKLIAVDGAANDEFGISVAVNGDMVVVGARQDDTRNGAAYVFTKVSGVWSQKAKLIASDGAADDEFGISVAVEGDTVVIGAYQDDDNGDLFGSAYVFIRDSSGGWRQRDKLTASDGAERDRYGYSVGVSGDTVVVGAYSDDSDEANTGAAYFLRIPGWTDIPDSAATTTSHIVTGLSNYVEHTFQVRGVNAAGGGLASDRAGGTPTFAIPNRPTGLAADAGDAVVDLTWVDPEDSTIEKYQLLQIIQGGKLTAASTDDPVVRGDGFGISVAGDGDTAVVGTYKDDDAGADSGSAHVFARSSPTAPWSWSAKLTASDAADNDEFGISVAVDGDTIVVGAHQNDSNKGAAYVFTWNSSNSKWEQKAKLTASDAAANDEFGISVAVDGDTIVVGAHKADYIDLNNSSNNLADSGAAYVFTKPESGGWADATETAKLTASDAAANDEFGIFVAVHGETVVVGAHQNDADDQDTNEGAAYVFTKTGGAWTSTTTAAKLTASDGEANDEFGVSVAVDEDTVAVGAHLHDLDVDGASMLDAGAVYVFTKPAAGWTSSTESAKLTATDGAAGDEFGISVAIDGDTVVTGAYRDDSMATDSDDGLDSGSVYVFDRDPESGKWSQTAKLTASNGDGGDRFGNSVAVDGDTAVVGAYLDDNPGIVLTDSGSVYVFTNQSGVWSEALNLAAPDAATDDHFGRSVAVAGGIVLAGVPQIDEDRPDAGSAYVMDISNAMWEDLKAEELTVSYEVKDLPVEEDYFYRVLDLTNDQEYAFRVRSVNAAGNHPSAETVSATPKLGRPVKPTGLVAEARDRAVELSWDLSDDSTLKHYQVLQHPEQSRFTASDGAGGDQFGSAVAVDGGTAVVGAPQDDDNGDNSGSAYVFTRQPLSGEWSQPIKLTASDGVEGDRFGYSVAVDESTVVVGAYWVDLNATTTNSGAAYVFTKPDGGDWTSTSTAAKLTASDGAGTDYFGHSVAVHGGTIVIGAHLHKTNDIRTGAAYVFTRPVGGWVATSTAATLTASDGSNGDQFGHSVAMDGATVVVGARRNSAAYAFIQDSGVWSQAAKFTASDSDGSEEFGSSVAVRGGTIVVGAYAANVDVCDPDESDDDDCDEDPRSGAAYLFTKPAGAFWANDPNEDNRKESGKLILPAGGEEEEDDQFGNSVALDGQSIVIGVPAGNDGFGSVHVSDIPQWAHIDDSKATTVSHRVTDLENGVKYTFQVRAVDKVSDVGAGTPSDIARATPLVRNHAPEFGLNDGVTLTVDEKESPDNHVGSAVTATDPEGNTLVYSLSGTHASSFRIGASNGQIAVGSGTTLDYESGLRKYSIIVSVNDGLDTDGDQDTTNDDSINVTINVNNVDEAGTVSLSTRPREGTALTASLTDPDGSVSDTSWQWARSANGSTGWRDIVRANSYRYRPVANDGGNYLRATASYTDGHGSGKEAAVVSTNRVRSLDRPETSPPSTPTPVPITVVPPGVGDATVPPGLLLVIGLMGMLLVIAGSIMVRERRSNRRL